MTAKQKLDKRLFSIEEGKDGFTRWTSKKGRFKGVLLTKKFKQEFEVFESKELEESKAPKAPKK